MIAIKGKDKAPESAAVQRARHKLEKQLAKEHTLITSTALENMGKALEVRLLKTTKERKPLKNKEIKIFDANQHPERIHNQYVRHLQNKIAGKVNHD